jgi:hypothetical protein
MHDLRDPYILLLTGRSWAADFERAASRVGC